MRVVTLNAGSGTLKVSAAEVVGDDVHVLRRAVQEVAPDATAGALERCLAELGEAMVSPDAVAHRVVHGGEAFQHPVRIDAKVVAQLERLVPLAPLHLPASLEVIRAALRRFADVPHAAVFDTAFHAGRSPESMLYALPDELAAPHGIRRYGFHGIAHLSLVEALASALGVDRAGVDAVTLQLGSGCSACAVEGGASIETTMGFTPLEGLVMATRCGDLDAGAVLHLLRNGENVESLERRLARRSGLLGLTGSADVREVLGAERAGDPRARMALGMFVRRIAMVVGAYWTLLGGRGALVFGGGIGTNSAEIRARVAARLGAWDVALDANRNRDGKLGCISRPGSRPVWVLRTDEERVLAREAARSLGPT